MASPVFANTAATGASPHTATTDVVVLIYAKRGHRRLLRAPPSRGHSTLLTISFHLLSNIILNRRYGGMSLLQPLQPQQHQAISKQRQQQEQQVLHCCNSHSSRRSSNATMHLAQPRIAIQARNKADEGKTSRQLSWKVKGVV